MKEGRTLMQSLAVWLHRSLDRFSSTSFWRRLKMFEANRFFRVGKALSILFFGLVMALGTARAFADSYVVKQVFSTQKDNFAAGDDFGDYTINVTNDFQVPGASCGGVISPIQCFLTHYVDGTTVYTTTPPPLRVNPSP